MHKSLFQTYAAARPLQIDGNNRAMEFKNDGLPEGETLNPEPSVLALLLTASLTFHVLTRKSNRFQNG